MWVRANYLQITGEVKERNRLFKALNEIKEIALLNCGEEISPELREQFEIIVEKCNNALKPVTSNNKR